METDRLLAVLEDAGLSQYQASAYVAVLELGTASVPEVAESSGVPDARVYDVLRNLAEQGYVELYEQDAMRVRAVDPTSAVEDLTARASRMEAAAEAVRDRWEAPALEGSDVTLVRRFETVEEAARTFVADAEVQVDAALTPTQFSSLRSELAAAYERGVTVNVAVLAADGDADLDADRFDGVCTAVRRRPRPFPFLVTVDARLTAFASNPAGDGVHGVLVDDRSFTAVFGWYFLSLAWTPWPERFGDDRLPVRYADVRHFLVTYGPVLRDGAAVTVEIDGVDIGGDEQRTIGGDVVAVETGIAESGDGNGTSGSFPREADLLSLAGQATVVVEDDGERVTVGAWGARREDLEARRFTVTDVRSNGE